MSWCRKTFGQGFSKGLRSIKQQNLVLFPLVCLSIQLADTSLLVSALINHFQHTQYLKVFGISHFSGNVLNCFQLQAMGKIFICSYSIPSETKTHSWILLFNLWLLAKCPNEELNANTQRTQYNLCIVVTSL